MVSSEHVVGATICDPSGKEIGSIDHLMIDPVTGQARYAVVDFCGFMCLRPGHHAVPWSALRFDESNRRYETKVTEKLLEEAPEFSDASWTDRDWETRIHRHYSAPPYWEGAAG
jgi:hypothetical protein